MRHERLACFYDVSSPVCSPVFSFIFVLRHHHGSYVHATHGKHIKHKKKTCLLKVQLYILMLAQSIYGLIHLLKRMQIPLPVVNILCVAHWLKFGRSGWVLFENHVGLWWPITSKSCQLIRQSSLWWYRFISLCSLSISILNHQEPVPFPFQETRAGTSSKSNVGDIKVSVVVLSVLTYKAESQH